jgi:PAS domain S-box-containing protein
MPLQPKRLPRICPWASRAGDLLADIDFRALFHALPGAYMVLDRNLRYVEVNAAYEAAVFRTRDELIGRDLFDLFPDAENGALLETSLRRALETGEPDTLAFIPYDIRTDAGVERRYWTAVHTPLRDAGGAVAWVMQNTVDVTELHRLRERSGPLPGETDLLQRAREAETASRALQRETAGLKELFRQAPGFMAVLSGPDHVFTLTNAAYQKVIGHRDVLGKTIQTALPDLVGQGFYELLDSVYASGEPYVGTAASVSLTNTPGSEPEERFLDFIYQPIRDDEGAVIGIFVEGSDVTERVRAEEQRKLLLDELNHRVKNTLATVQSIAAQTLRTTPDPVSFRAAFEARLLALSGVHNLLTEANWEGARLDELLRMELTPHGTDRFTLEGPPVRLAAPQALTIALVSHELATNAAKYGALSASEGRVGVRWDVAATSTGERLTLDWRETGGPPVVVPTRRGFGSRLIERSIREDIHGEASIAYEPDGLRCRIALRIGA